mmetsp:Transcript_122552/g.240512  ORF Transcript_122552/g.240512 Transcript_122552/m.240512 type:complete len:265 (+) Transcript_122552:234-1028(+)
MRRQSGVSCPTMPSASRVIAGIKAATSKQLATHCHLDQTSPEGGEMRKAWSMSACVMPRPRLRPGQMRGKLASFSAPKAPFQVNALLRFSLSGLKISGSWKTFGSRFAIDTTYWLSSPAGMVRSLPLSITFVSSFKALVALVTGGSMRKASLMYASEFCLYFSTILAAVSYEPHLMYFAGLSPGILHCRKAATVSHAALVPPMPAKPTPNTISSHNCTTLWRFHWPSLLFMSTKTCCKPYFSTMATDAARNFFTSRILMLQIAR